ncbi:hypothetical protein PM082_011060 [Marasmius tenuissimus]|nr:hypothetical protein PM082_011060 [Marasmius tenuissimus]
MPHKTVAEVQDRLREKAASFFIAADALDEDMLELDSHDDDVFEAFQIDEAMKKEQENDEELAMVLMYLGAELIYDSEELAGDGTRGPYLRYPRSQDFFQSCLQLPDRLFRAMFRVSHEMFNILVELLSRDPIFHSKGHKPQRPVAWQVATFLV